MTRDAISRISDGVFTMELVEDARVPEVSLEAIERIHISSATALCWATFELALARFGNMGHAIAAGAAVMAFIGLVFAQNLRAIMGDFYRQMQYREKLVVFLVHVGIVVAAIAGASATPSVALSLLLVILCFEGIDTIFFGRIMALSMVIALMQLFQFPVNAGALIIGVYTAWFALWLLTVRVTYVRFRMEKYGEGRGADLMDMLRRTLLLVIVPAACWLGVFLYADPRMTRRAILWMPMQESANRQPPLDLSLGSIILYAVEIIGVVIACLALLKWLDKLLVRTKKGAAISDEIAGAGLRILRGEDSAEKAMVEDPPSGPRERILRGFRKFSADQITRGLVRRGEETAEDYFNRLGGADTAAAEPFNKACYAVEEPTDAEAAQFFDGIREVEKRISKPMVEMVSKSE